MGAYTLLPLAARGLRAGGCGEGGTPTVARMAERGTPFVGVLFLRSGCDQPRRARYRVQRTLWRPGNPGGSGASAHPLGQLLRAAARGEISEGTELDWDPRTAVDVVMAAENYPDTPRKGDVISGLDEGERPGGRARDSRGHRGFPARKSHRRRPRAGRRGAR